MDPALRCGATLLGKYRIDRVLGQGGMGVVLKVTHVQLGEELAIKILLPDGAAQPETHARFLREAQSVARLRGEHVARMVDVGQLPDGSPYMLMEYLHGTDLAAELHRRGRLAIGEAVDHMLQACAALAEAHANGIVHRDVKPGNLFLTTRLDGSPLIKVLDFGISKDPSGDAAQLTQTQTMMGTPGYMSPEHMKATKQVDARTDLWSLGVVLYECLNGRRPFVSDSFSGVVIKVATEPPDAMDPEIPEALRRVVLRCLEKDRNARWATAAELAASLAPFARDPDAAALAVAQAQQLGRGPRLRTAPGGVPVVPSVPTVPSGRVSQASLPTAPPRLEPGHRRLPSPTTLSASAGATHGRPARPAPRRAQWAYGRIAVAVGTLVVMLGIGLALLLRSDADEAPAVAVTPRPPVETKPIAMTAVPPPAPAPVVPTPAAGSADLAAGSAAAGSAAVGSADLTAGSAAVGSAAVGSAAAGSAAAGSAAAGSAAAGSAAAGSADLATGSAAMGSAAAGSAAAGSADLATGSAAGSAAEAPRAAPCEAELGDTIATAANNYAKGGARSALALITKALECRHSDNMYLRAGIYACAALDAKAAKLYFGKTSPQQQPTIAQKCQQVGIDLGKPSPPAACAKVNADDVMARAANQYAGGHAASAVTLADTALACQQSGRMYWLATIYACGAGDRARARRYFSHAPADLQPGLVERCAKQNVSLR